MRYISTFVLAAAAVMVGAGAAAAQSTTHTTRDTTMRQSHGEMAPAKRIPEDSARKIALAAVSNGTIKSHELEREHGKWIYSYDISQPNMSGTEEVNVSATDGTIVGKHHESASSERAEKAGESHRMHHTGTSATSTGSSTTSKPR